MKERYITERVYQKNLLLKDGDYKSTKEIVQRVAEYLPDTNLICELDEKRQLVYHTARDILLDVESLGDGLIDMGLSGKHVAISADNSYMYVVCDLSISGGVGVVTPIDKDAPEGLFATLLNKCDAEAIICSHYLLKKLNAIRGNCGKLKTVITIDKKVDGYPFIAEVMERGKALSDKKIYHDKKLDLSAPAKILFTSGTTGANKAVVLTQNNLAANVINCMDMIRIPKTKINTSMSVLPMHHATEINTHIIPRIACGKLTYINDSMKNLLLNIKVFKPSIITVVPMIANAFYKGIWTNAKKSGKDGKLKKGIKLCKLVKAVTGKDITHSLFSEVYQNFGGNLNQIIVGGAMLNPEVVKGFRDLGVYIVNGYGITECGPLVSMNTETVKEIYSIGKPCPSLNVKIFNPDVSGIGELCVKGKSVFKGYYKDSDATKKVLDSDGYFHTGDIAYIDKKGRIFLSGRKKNTIVLSNGKNVYPEELENEIANKLPYVSDVVVYSAPNLPDTLCAGVYIEEQSVREDFEKIKADFISLNATLSNYKRISLICLADSPYEKTSTKKIKRDTVDNIHATSRIIKI